VRTNTCPVFAPARTEVFDTTGRFYDGLRTQTCPL
jgi:hypothetical protein